MADVAGRHPWSRHRRRFAAPGGERLSLAPQSQARVVSPDEMSVRVRSWPVYVLLVLCWGIVIARVIWPKLNFDTISLILFAIGTAAALLPTVLTVLPPITRLKLFEVEAEFGRHINELE